MTQAGAPFLELTGIRKSFGRFEALKGVSLGVERGELMVFLGPSGCGKTTLLRIIAGLEGQDEGRLVQDGRDITRLPAIRRDYGIVFQSYALFPNLTVDAERCLWAGQPPRGARRDSHAGRGVAQAHRIARCGSEVSGPAVGRPAAADRACPRDRDLAGIAAARRAAVGTRRARARAAARRDPRAAAAPRRDHDHGDARSGGGAVDRRSRRRDERRLHRAGRNAARSVRTTGHFRSPPTSSARST